MGDPIQHDHTDVLPQCPPSQQSCTTDDNADKCRCKECDGEPVCDCATTCIPELECIDRCVVCPTHDPCPPLRAGTYTNATIVVNDNGCIESIETGEPFVYEPPSCCGTTVSGGGTQGLRGEKGKDGKSATVSIGTVKEMPNGYPVRVYNTGSSTNAVFNFEFPKAECICESETEGHTGTVLGGLDFEDGLLKEVDAVRLASESFVKINGSPAINDKVSNTYKAEVVVEKNPADPNEYTIEVDVSALKGALGNPIGSTNVLSDEGLFGVANPSYIRDFNNSITTDYKSVLERVVASGCLPSSTNGREFIDANYKKFSEWVNNNAFYLLMLFRGFSQVTDEQMCAYFNRSAAVPDDTTTPTP